DAGGRRAHHRPGRSDVRRLGHARRGGRAWRGRRGHRAREHQSGDARGRWSSQFVVILSEAKDLLFTYFRATIPVSHTVLLCDDAIFMRTMVGDILQKAGFEVIGEAETGAQAIEKYKQLKPDIVTMDIVMPELGGIDAVREIRKHDPNARVLMCSAMGQQAL